MALICTIFSSSLSASIPQKADDFSITDSEPNARYVVVYEMNGGTHVVFINKEICCTCLEDFIATFELQIRIIDCGHVGAPVPPDANLKTEEEALNDFQLEDWP